MDHYHFQRAWEMVFERHEILRSTVQHPKKGEPVIVVLKRVKPVINWLNYYIDPTRVNRYTLRHGSDKFIENVLEGCVNEGLNLFQAPSSRITMCEIAPDRHWMIWSCHHSLIDGWSSNIVINDVLTSYSDSIGDQTSSLPPTVSLGRYYKWLAAKDKAVDTTYWKEKLAGFSKPTQLVNQDLVTPSMDEGTSEFEMQLGADLGELIAITARKNGTTVNIVILAAWSILLRGHVKNQEITFGVVSSGRSPQLDGAEGLVGMFNVALPLRVQLENISTVGELLGAIHRLQQEMIAHSQVSLIEIIQQCDDFQRRYRPFESLLVFENFVDRRTKKEVTEGLLGQGLSMDKYQSGLQLLIL